MLARSAFESMHAPPLTLLINQHDLRVIGRRGCVRMALLTHKTSAQDVKTQVQGIQGGKWTLTRLPNNLAGRFPQLLLSLEGHALLEAGRLLYLVPGQQRPWPPLIHQLPASRHDLAAGGAQQGSAHGQELLSTVLSCCNSSIEELGFPRPSVVGCNLGRS